VGNWRAPDDQTYDVNVRLARCAHHARRTWSACPLPWRRRRQQRIVRLNQVAQVAKHRPQPDQPPRPDARGRHQRQRLLRSAGEVSADIKQAGQHRLPPGYRYQFGGSTKNMAESFGYAMSALAWPSSSST
jgi:HAE1 family hydrophobic/amphiphilic exporter-1